MKHLFVRRPKVLGHGSRVAPARAYCIGLLLLGERKSIVPMPARIAAASRWCSAYVLLSLRLTGRTKQAALQCGRSWIRAKKG